MIEIGAYLNGGIKKSVLDLLYHYYIFATMFTLLIKIPENRVFFLGLKF